MSKFDELKKAAEAAIEREDCDRFIERDDAQLVLELLAIRAQLVEALKLTLDDIEQEENKWRVANKKGSRHVTKARIVRAALRAAGAQP